MKITPDAFVITSLDIIIHDDRKLGEGGFASVFEGDWRGTKVAVKLLERGIPSSVGSRFCCSDNGTDLLLCRLYNKR